MGEGIRPVVAQVAAVRVDLGFGLARGGVGGAEDLEGFQEGGK